MNGVFFFLLPPFSSNESLFLRARRCGTSFSPSRKDKDSFWQNLIIRAGRRMATVFFFLSPFFSPPFLTEIGKIRRPVQVTGNKKGNGGRTLFFSSLPFSLP